ncbi:LuxR C-terminal-related transcriptional regulator [Microbacterium foliorum]
MTADPNELLAELATVLAAPLLDIAPALSRQLTATLPHSALVIFTEDCTGRPQKKAGARAIIDKVTIGELDALREETTAAGHAFTGADAVIAGESRPVAAWVSTTNALLVLTHINEPTAEIAARIGRVWEIVAIGIRHQVAAAGPAYLRDSRMASSERSRVIGELTDAHATTLELLLSVLRSRSASDTAARQSAIDIASSAMVNLKSAADRDRMLSEEPVTQAFERLRDELRPLERFRDLDIQFVEPPVDGRALPGEVAHAGRAIVRGAVLAVVEQPGVGRVRVQWDCDGSNLLIGIRDDGPGTLDAEARSVEQLAARVAALNGDITLSGTPGWGSELSVALPLDAPSPDTHVLVDWTLTSREKHVLQLLASGARNRTIAASLGISENTVKYHVANLLRKSGANNRAELTALVR